MFADVVQELREHVADTSNGEVCCFLLYSPAEQPHVRLVQMLHVSLGATERSATRDCDCTTQVERNMFLKHLLSSNLLEEINSLAGVMATHAILSSTCMRMKIK